MDVVITASGKKINTDMVSAIPQPHMLYIRVVGMSIAEAAFIFSNPEEIKELKYGTNRFVGYYLDALIPEGGAVRVNMRRD